MPRPDGKPTIAEIIGDEEEDDRDDKPWPVEDDCPTCPGHKDGPHKFSCATGGAEQYRLPAKLIDDA